jgi:hypothetical protein
MATETISYDKADLRGIVKLSKLWMIKLYHRPKAFQMDWPLTFNPKSSAAAGSRPNKLLFELLKDRGSASHQKIGEMSFGFVSQKFSGGGSTQQLWGGYEFGSNKYKNFRFGRVSKAVDRLVILFIQH